MQPAPSAQAAHRRGLLLIVLSALLWGTVGVTTQSVYLLAETTPLSVALLRLALSLPALALACGVILGRRTFRIARPDLAVMLLLGGMLALYQICYFGAIPLVGVAVATLITLCAAPVLVALVSLGLLRERPTPRLLLALGCALAGTALLVDRSADELPGSLPADGVGLALGSALGYAVVTLCSRALARRYHPLQPVLIGFGVGTVVLLPLALAAELRLEYPPLGWALLLYLGVVPTALAYALFTQGMRHTSATAASILTLVEPLTAAGLAWLLFGERLGPFGLAGGALLLGAVLLLATGREPFR